MRREDSSSARAILNLKFCRGARGLHEREHDTNYFDFDFIVNVTLICVRSLESRKIQSVTAFVCFDIESVDNCRVPCLAAPRMNTNGAPSDMPRTHRVSQSSLIRIDNWVSSPFTHVPLSCAVHCFFVDTRNLKFRQRFFARALGKWSIAIAKMY